MPIVECIVCKRFIYSYQEKKLHMAICEQKVYGATINTKHDYYGCNSGCCGHMIYIEKDGDIIYEKFEFEHSKEEIIYRVNELAHQYHLTVGKCEILTNCYQ